MVAFRKLFIALALVTLFAVAASAQTTNICSASAFSLPFVRAEGITEPAGLIQVSCTGTPADDATIRVLVSTQVTNKVDSDGVTTVPLVRGDGTTVSVGTVTGANIIEFSGVNIPATATTFTVGSAAFPLRINASSGGQSQFGLNQFSAQVLGISAGTAQLLFASNSINIAVSQAGMTVKRVDDNAAGLPQCRDLNNNPDFEIKDGEPALTDFVGTPVTVEVAEGFRGAFADPSSTTAVRVVFRFGNLPAGATVWAPKTVGPAVIIKDAKADFSGGSTNGGTGTKVSDNFVNLAGNTAVYQITAAVGVATPAIDFPFALRFAANAPAVTTGINVTAAFAPISTVVTADKDAPLPRFVDAPKGPVTLFNINACQTVLLFPYVTNQDGFDTGVAIINTSMDASGDFAETGPCTVSFFGKTSDGNTPTNQLLPAIAAGDLTQFALSGGSFPEAQFVDANGAAVTDSVSAAGFRGYMIATCNFEYAHGYAFVSDSGASKLAHGYVALVLKGSNTAPARGNSSEGVEF